MNSIFRTFITVFVLFLALSTPSDAESEKWRRYEETLIKISTDPEYTKLWPEHIKQFKNYEAIAFKKQKRNSFPCSTYSSPEVPSSVHQLQPGDIKVVGAMGDSITAGNGINALTPIGALTEYRGHSWSIGGVNTFEEVLTLPNILKKYNPDLTGYATGTGKRDSSVSKLNVAYPGNTAENMPLQAAMLVDRIKSMPGVDFENDWKMVTLFIGGNDLCDYCYDVVTVSDHCQKSIAAIYPDCTTVYDLKKEKLWNGGRDSYSPDRFTLSHNDKVLDDDTTLIDLHTPGIEVFLQIESINFILKNRCNGTMRGIKYYVNDEGETADLIKKFLRSEYGLGEVVIDFFNSHGEVITLKNSMSLLPGETLLWQYYR